MEADRFLTLPEDLLIHILRCLETTAVIRCAAVCRPWRRAIIANASCLRPRPDRFLPDLLLGFLDKYLSLPRRLQYVPASSNTEVPSLLTPATSIGVRVEGRLYNNLLSSRDGFLLLGEDKNLENLCLCSALTGACKILPAAAALQDTHPVPLMYVLATCYDDDVQVEDHFDDEAVVWILAVKWLGDSKDGITYQIFSSTSGAWGPVRCSAKFSEDVANVLTKPSSSRGAVVVCHSVVSWFLYLYSNSNVVNRLSRTCIFSVDLRTQQTWTTELPDFSGTLQYSPPVLAVSEDGQLCLARMLTSPHPRMEVWVLVGDRQWMLRRAIDDVQKLLPAGCPSMDHMWLTGLRPVRQRL